MLISASESIDGVKVSISLELPSASFLREPEASISVYEDSQLQALAVHAASRLPALLDSVMLSVSESLAAALKTS
jgi:hypothetical protein